MHWFDLEESGDFKLKGDMSDCLNLENTIENVCLN